MEIVAGLALYCVRAENAAKALAHSLAKQEISRQSESHLLEQKRELQESHSKAQQEIDRLLSCWLCVSQKTDPPMTVRFSFLEIALQAGKA